MILTEPNKPRSEAVYPHLEPIFDKLPDEAKKYRVIEITDTHLYILKKGYTVPCVVKRSNDTSWLTTNFGLNIPLTLGKNSWLLRE